LFFHLFLPISTGILILHLHHKVCNIRQNMYHTSKLSYKCCALKLTSDIIPKCQLTYAFNFFVIAYCVMLLPSSYLHGEGLLCFMSFNDKYIYVATTGDTDVCVCRIFMWQPQVTLVCVCVCAEHLQTIVSRCHTAVRSSPAVPVPHCSG
jgi:hypothetical protein